MITTNAIARTEGAYAEQMRTTYAITAQIAELQERIQYSNNDFIKQAWTVAIIELQQLQRTLETKRVKA
jgi:hypothetical protein